jgi:endo-1,4-beta-xylanase
METRTLSQRKILYALFCTVLLFPVLSCNDEQEEYVGKPWNEYSPLHEMYAGQFLVGNIIRNTGDFSNTTRFGILKRHYNTVTAENDMKPQYIAPNSNPGSVSAVWNYQFTTADKIVNDARSAGFVVHGHTLIWHSQSPSWLADGGEDYLNKFVDDVVKHFKGKLISWDVVNEAFRDGLTESDAVNWKTCLRQDAPWYQSIGADYIEKAFRAARAADPSVKLYYNDYNLNGIGKRLATYNMVKEINDKWRDNGNPGLLIDGIGMQSHHHINTDPESVKASIIKFIELGVKIDITELDIVAANGGDVYDSRLGAWNDDAARRQAAQYAAMFMVFLEYSPHITRVTFWGLDDGTSWRSANYPTLLDKNYNAKPAFEAVRNPWGY